MRNLSSLFVAALLSCANAFGHSGGVDKNGCHVDKSADQRHCHSKLAKSVCDGRVPAIGDENVFYGPVVSVIDGDTFKVKIQGADMTFRMADIDAPEMDQPFGWEARALLKSALDRIDVVMLRVDADSHGRPVVHVWFENRHINREMVAQGAAWFYAEYANDNCLYEVENEARDAKRGLWKLPPEKLVEPWVWRQRKRDAAEAKRHKKSATRVP